MNMTVGRLLQNVGYLYSEGELVKEMSQEQAMRIEQLERELETALTEKTGLEARLNASQEREAALREEVAKAKTAKKSAASNR